MSVTGMDADLGRRRPRPAAGGLLDAREALTRELADVLFTSFVRRDQREKGEQYLRGLLRARGRKSIRNVAAHVGGPAAEQSLHHFISSSTWDWMPVREALAAHLEQAIAPQAWVVRSMPILKAGHQSVGVDRVFDPCLGHAFRGQHAFGVWYANEMFSVPVHWRLHLPETWVQDDNRRRRADIPEAVGEESAEECASAAVLMALTSWQVPVRPVVLNTHVTRIAATVGRFTQAGVPVIVRASGASPVTVRDPALPGYGAGPLGAQQILAAVRGLGRRVEWTDPASPSRTRCDSVAVAVRVGGAARSGRPGRDGTREGELMLLGEWESGSHVPTAMWITNMASVPVGTLLRMTKLAGRARRDLEQVGEHVGLKDFEGRSFSGWHRHITLASAAHAVVALAGSGSAPHLADSA
ncbi:transposase [Streptomyces sp. Rer75]|uniref:IS701 family transposase n=1 Tax=Streptomyces sp. Rer75 TaxID=2750011 RepID=UPI0015CFC0D6|nr:transposase [Streptomyces sp. Rer75]QLH21594.1 transposase [Streptomyces sp. Rer75]